ncbi:MAG: Ig-like domain-containing protein [Balneolaceae bacterium]
MKTSHHIFLLLLLFVLAGSCATPISPTGGPPDRQGPRVVATVPENGTTNFDGDAVRFHFNEFIDRNSVRQNVNIEPDLAINFEVSFGRKSATVSFTDPLPDSTTIVIRLGTDVTDMQRNKMASPVSLAISTGDVLDDGKVEATIVNSGTGERESGNRVFLYRTPADFTERANYMAETDTSGSIEFSYLSEGTYKAIWIDDINRSRSWDQNRESAQPFSVEQFELQQGETVNLGTLFISVPDTLPPLVEGVGLLSERRLRLRLSEPVRWDNEAVLAVMDTLENEVTQAYPLYTSESDENVVFAQSTEPLVEEESYTLSPSGIHDEAGNELRIDISPFQGSSEPDTTELATVSHNAGSGLFPDESLEITYTKFIDDDAVVDSLSVLEGSIVFSDWEQVQVERNVLRISPQDRWESGTRYQFRVWNPFTQEREQIEPEFWQRNQLGGIEFIMENSDTTTVKHLRLEDLEGSIRMDTTFTDTLLVDNLPPMEYQAIVFEDENENGVWDPGTAEPYRRPERYIIRRNIPVREGFTSEVNIRFPEGFRRLTPGEEQMQPIENIDEIEDES